MKKNIKWIICIFSLAVFIILTCLVLSQKELFIDNVIYNFISKLISDNMTNVVKFITFLGSASVVIAITILVLLIVKNKKIGLLLSLNLICITIFQYVLKQLIGRNRPVGINIIKESSFSFPSGHSLTALAFYGYIIYLINKHNFKYKKLYTILLSILILLIGLSRVYLGVHYITDVLGGFTFSLCYLIIFIHLTKKILNKKKHQK